jgi:hypothetical protein
MSGPQNGGQGFGGGEQGERLEGSLTDGGAVPGHDEDDERRFGAGREIPPQTSPAPPMPPTPDGDVPGDDAAIPGEEQSGYGNTPPR